MNLFRTKSHDLISHTIKYFYGMLCVSGVIIHNITLGSKYICANVKKSATCPLKKNIAKAGLVLRLNVPGDENCPFHAVSDQLKRLKLQRYRHRQLRELAVKQLKTHPIMFSSKHIKFIDCSFFNIG